MDERTVEYPLPLRRLDGGFSCRITVSPRTWLGEIIEIAAALMIVLVWMGAGVSAPSAAEIPPDLEKVSPDLEVLAPDRVGPRDRPSGSSSVHERVDCRGRTDGTEAVRAMLRAAAGGTLWIPSACRILLASPGPGASALDIPSHTRIFCADRSAGFVLARRSCAGGDLPGAHCTVDTDCPGHGECRDDVPGRFPFAHRTCADEPTRPCAGANDCGGGTCVIPTEPYTVFSTADGAAHVTIVGCSIDVRQRSRDTEADVLYGTCHGGAADGRACRQICSNSPAGTIVACNRDEDCRGPKMGECLQAKLCGQNPEGAGDCLMGAGQPGHPAGPGKVNVIDFSRVAHALVDDVWIWDHVFGDFGVSLGTDGRLTNGGIGLARSEGPKGIFVGGGYFGRPVYGQKDQHVGAAVITGEQARVSGNLIRGGAVAVLARPASSITENVITCADRGGWAYRYCEEDAARPIPERRSCRSDEDCAADCSTDGPDCIGILVDGDQNSIVANRIWATFTGIAATAQGFNTTVSSNRIVHGEGAKIAIRGSGWTIADNYLAWGTLPKNGPVLQIGPSEPDANSVLSDHTLVTGNLIFGGQGDTYQGLVHLGLSDPGGGVHRNALVSNNVFLLEPTQVGIDLSELREASLLRSSIVANSIQGGDTGIEFPEDSSRVLELVVAANGLSGTRVPLRNWSWDMGDAVANAPLSPADDSVQVVYLRSGEAKPLERGDVLAIGTDGDRSGRVVRAPPDSHRIAGVALAAADHGEVVRVATSGTTDCRVEVGWLSSVGAGDPLGVGGTAGRLATTDDPAATVATALESASSGSTIRCLLR